MIMCILYHSLTWSTYQVASRKGSYWEWTTNQIKCPCRPQVEDDLCREMIAYPQRILPLDGCPCVRHFSYLLFHCSACQGCADLKFPGGGVVFVPSEIIFLQSLRAQPAVQFWNSVVFILPAKGKIVRPYSFQNQGLGVPGDEAEESSFMEMWNGCVFFTVAYCFNGQIKWRLLCYVASHLGIMCLPPVFVF